jgi:lysophospholipase L1-like esterase
MKKVSIILGIVLVGFLALLGCVKEVDYPVFANTTDPLHPIGPYVIKDNTRVVQDTIVDVSGKKALFIGDSHTSNHSAGWQVVVCKKTKLKMNNVSVSGKTTGWMLQMAKQNLSSNYDYCFIYGGGNDAAGKTPIKKVVKNIQAMVDLCHVHKVIPIVLTGFDPIKCTRSKIPNYAQRYAAIQKGVMDSVSGAIIVDTRVVDRLDCWDELCHMNPTGHKKVANQVIKTCKFKTY